MKKILLACAFTALSVSATQSRAELPTATPLYSCWVDALVTQDAGFTFGLRVINVTATGQMSCLAWDGKSSTQNVVIQINGVGVGPEIAGPVTRIRIAALKAGIATPNGMYGQYALQAGPNLALGGVRVGVAGGVEMTPGQSLAAKVQVSLECVNGLGFDVSASMMTISAAPGRRH